MHYANQTFTGEVALDHNTFDNCIFDRGCCVTYSGGTYTLDDCRFHSDISVALKGPACNTLKFLALLNSFASINDLLANAAQHHLSHKLSSAAPVRSASSKGALQ